MNINRCLSTLSIVTLLAVPFIIDGKADFCPDVHDHSWCPTAVSILIGRFRQEYIIGLRLNFVRQYMPFFSIIHKIFQ